MQLGGNIKNIRESKNMSQMEVVEKMQLMGSTTSKSSYAKIEAEQINIKASDLVILKFVLDVEFEQLLEFDLTDEE